MISSIIKAYNKKITVKHIFCLVKNKNGEDVLVVEPNPRNIGHLLIEIYLGFYLAQKYSSSIYILRPDDVCNDAVCNVQSKFVKNIKKNKTNDKIYQKLRNKNQKNIFGLERTPFYINYMPNKNYITKWNKIFSLFETLPATIGTNKFILKKEREWSIKKNTLPGYLPREALIKNLELNINLVEKKKAVEELKSIGVLEHDKIVILHCREEGYKLGNEIKDESRSLHGTGRNVNIENYFPAIDYLVNQKYKILRIGDNSMKRIDRRGVLDLAHLDISETANLLGIFWSEFIIGSQSGPCIFGPFTNTPILMVNCIDPIAAFPIRSNDRFLLKKMIAKKLNYEMSLKDMWTKEFLDKNMDGRVFEAVENDANTILNAVKEYTNASFGIKTNNQKNYNKISSQLVKDLNSIPYVKKWGDHNGVFGYGTFSSALQNQNKIINSLKEISSEELTINQKFKKFLFLFNAEDHFFTYSYKIIQELLKDGHKVTIIILSASSKKQLKILGSYKEHHRNIEDFNKRYPENFIVFRRYNFGNNKKMVVKSLINYCRTVIHYNKSIYQEFKHLRERYINKKNENYYLVKYLRNNVSDHNKFEAILRYADNKMNLGSIKNLIQFVNPNVLVANDLVKGHKSPIQSEFVKIAMNMKINTAYHVQSWDNLTNKSKIMHKPNLTLVWNKPQAMEAEEIHSINKSNIKIVGSSNFEHWFNRKPLIEEKKFKKFIGLKIDEEYILYLGSSIQIAPNESNYFNEWFENFKNSNSVSLKKVKVFLRLHPLNKEGNYNQRFKNENRLINNDDIDFIGWPFSGDEFHFCLQYYSALVSGLNTSAMMQSTIFGKKIFTMINNDFGQLSRSVQETLHFKLMINYEGGATILSNSWDSHFKKIIKELNLIKKQKPNLEPNKFAQSFLNTNTFPAKNITKELLILSEKSHKTYDTYKVKQMHKILIMIYLNFIMRINYALLKNTLNKLKKKIKNLIIYVIKSFIKFYKISVKIIILLKNVFKKNSS